VQKRTDLCAHDFAHSPDMWHQSRLANVTWDLSCRLDGINHAKHTFSARFQQNKRSISSHGIAPTDMTPPLHAYVFTLTSVRNKINSDIRKELEANNTRQIHCWCKYGIHWRFHPCLVCRPADSSHLLRHRSLKFREMALFHIPSNSLPTNHHVFRHHTQPRYMQ
jgi:hypothetical protein